MRSQALNHHHLETKIGDKISALVLDRVRTFDALERFFGVFVAERGGSLVIAFRGARILWPAASLLRERAHPLQLAGVILRRRLLGHVPRAHIVPGPTATLPHHPPRPIPPLAIPLPPLSHAP